MNIVKKPTGQIIMRISALFMLGIVISSVVVAQSPDPIPPLLVSLKSGDLPTRQKAFYSLLKLGAPVAGQPATGDLLASEIANVLSGYPNDAPQIVSALSSLLTLENSGGSLGSTAPAPQDEDDSDFYLDVVEAVAALNNPSTISSLVGAIGSGAIVTSRLASFGPAALDPVVALTYSSYVHDRNAAAFTLMTMLSKQYAHLVSDTTSQSKIRAGLVRAIASFAPPSPYSYVQATYQSALAAIGPSIVGDLNGDGLLSCLDLDIVVAALGSKVGEPRFDIRADLDGDGKVNGRDLFIEARYIANALRHYEGHDADFDDVLKRCHIEGKRDHDNN
jgi:Dockerin type I domain